MKFAVFQTTHQGGRQKNEDRMGYCYSTEAALFFLADGMGGHPEGDKAAQIALESIANLFLKKAAPQLADVPAFLESAVITAHRQIILYAAEQGLNDAPRTTLVMLVVQQGVASWLHCGDSRLYFVRDGAMLTRTRDHSYVEQREMGRSLSDAPKTFNRNVLYTCLGSPVRPQFDISEPIALLKGDKLMLCSDGLWDSVDDASIVAHLASQAVDKAAPELVERALRQAGPGSDNVTVLALEWETPEGCDTSDFLN
jgi:serine/threonine protein phosphatase PrpC